MTRLTLATALLLASCANSPIAPKSPDQALFEANTAYAAALTVIVAYGKAPICPGDTWAVGCANGPFLILARNASNSAGMALSAAQPFVAAWKAISAPNATDTQRAMAAVNAAGLGVQAVSTLAAQLKG